MTRALFGTDGIRGKAGVPPLDKQTLYALGRTLGQMIQNDASCFARQPVSKTITTTATLGGDTRDSTAWILQAIAQGLQQESISLLDAGTASTPQIAWLTQHSDSAIGIVISASHNPWQDNGVKCFSPGGYKINDDAEAAIATLLPENTALSYSNSADTKAMTSADPDRYTQDVIARFQKRLDLSGMRIVIDCANGACSHIAPQVLQALGADLIVHHASPNGENINDQCGALYPEHLGALMQTQAATLGLSFDGDGDRVMFIDEAGLVRDGDYVLAILADAYEKNNRLTGQTVVGTVMSNLGLQLFLQNRGLQLERTAVGDRHISDCLLRHGYAIGGEQSGHVIVPHEGTTGDGLLTALIVLETLQQHWKGSLQAASGLLQKCPQLLVNIPVREKKPFDAIPGLSDTVAHLEAELDGKGRILLRYSGTEDLARVMVEGQDDNIVRTTANTLADLIRQDVGSTSNASET